MPHMPCASVQVPKIPFFRLINSISCTGIPYSDSLMNDHSSLVKFLPSWWSNAVMPGLLRVSIRWARPRWYNSAAILNLLSRLFSAPLITYITVSALSDVAEKPVGRGSSFFKCCMSKRSISRWPGSVSAVPSRHMKKKTNKMLTADTRYILLILALHIQTIR